MQNLIRAFLKSGVLILLIPGLFFVSCRSDKGKNIPDVSDIDMNIKIHRFEKNLMNIDTSNVSAGMNVLIEKYPVFMKEIYLQQVIQNTICEKACMITMLLRATIL